MTAYCSLYSLLSGSPCFSIKALYTDSNNSNKMHVKNDIRYMCHQFKVKSELKKIMKILLYLFSQNGFHRSPSICICQLCRCLCYGVFWILWPTVMYPQEVGRILCAHGYHGTEK